MKKLSIPIMLMVMALVLIPASPSQTHKITGIWLGKLEVGGVQLRLAVTIKMSADGSLSATMDSIDQGAADIPLDQISFADGVLTFANHKLMLTYSGKVNEAFTQISGTFSQRGFTKEMSFTKVDKTPELKRPQEPKPPLPYLEEEVSYSNKKAGIKLAGTLTLPKGKGPFPAVVLITGSGAQDRNETVAGHRPFLVLSDYLTRQNIAVLRADDRGVGGSEGDIATSTTWDFAYDALAGVAFLKTKTIIDPSRIGLIGHSEGGIIAPIAASLSPDVAYIVLMAGTGMTGEEIIHLQTRLIMRANGEPEKKIEKAINQQKSVFKIIKQSDDPAKLDRMLRKSYQEEMAQLSEAERNKEKVTEEQLTAQIKQYTSRWFRYFLTYDPKPVLRKVRCPVLVINGEKDLQVPMKENLNAIRNALQQGGNSRVTVKSFPGLNHLFQTARTGSPNEYSKISETISPVVLDFISQWILKQGT